MTKIIIFLGAILLLWIIIRQTKAYKPKQKHQSHLDDYEKRRLWYYAQERKKVIQHYRTKVAEGSMSIEDALHDAVRLMAFNSGGDKNWKKEFLKFKQELQSLRDKA